MSATERIAETNLSFAQERMWFLELLNPGAAAYNIATATLLRGCLRPAALREATAMLTQRHPLLRARFPSVDGVPRCEILDEASLPFAECELAAAADDRVLQEEIDREAARPFDLGRGPLARARLIRLNPEEHVFTLTLHHLVADGRSLQVLFCDLSHLYETIVAGQPAALDPLSTDFFEVAASERAAIAAGRHADSVAFWAETLAGAATLELPTDRSRPAVRDGKGGEAIAHVPERVVKRLEEVARECSASLYIVLLVAFASFLARYAGQADVVLGSPVANRRRSETEDVVGLFVNTVAMRATIDEDLSLRQLVKLNRDRLLDALDHGDIPFDHVVGELRPDRDLGLNPLFQVMFALESGEQEQLRITGLDSVALDPRPGVARFDLECTCWRQAEGLRVRFNYATDVFDESSGVRLQAHFLRLLEAVAEGADIPVATARLMDDEEEEDLLGRVNPLSSPDLASDFATLFERQAARRPDALALLAAGEEISYAELEARAEAVARRLEEIGIGEGSMVGLCASRSATLVAAVLGALKAGAAFVPLDPADPAARRRRLLERCGAEAVLTDGVVRLADFRGLRLVRIDELSPVHSRRRRRQPSRDAAAYVIHTSGSSGSPKGVLVTRRNLLHTLVGCGAWFGFRETDTFACLAAHTFDIFYFELLSPLLCGAAALLVGREEMMDPARLVPLLQRATVIQAVPGLMEQVLRALESRGVRARAMRYAITGGDTVPVSLPAKMAVGFPGATVTVLYGPTETTMVCAGIKLEHPEGVRGHPLGRPLPNVCLRLYDSRGRLVPVGVPGEMYIGGAGVAAGYLGGEKVDRDRFVEIGGERFYRSGDRARWSSGGELLFLGRVDRQLKVRGFRIEPGEVERALETMPEVARAAVVRAGDGEAERLAAFLVPRGELEESLAAKAIAFAEASLPRYMVPSSVHLVEQLPLRANAKLDHETLAARAEALRSAAVTPREPPATPMERALAEVWQRVLGIEHLGRETNFFAAGGTSLGAIEVAVRLRALDIRISAQDVFRHQSIASLGAAIDQGRAGEDAPQNLPVGASAGAPAPRPARAQPERRERIGAATRVLLTGATGFLGIHLLQALLDRGLAVSCLVRGESDSASRLRLLDQWRWYFPRREPLEERVEVVAADLAQPRLGLSSRRWSALGSACDHLVNAGADVRHVARADHLFAVNRDGVERLLELACSGPETVFHQVSTVGVAGATPTGGRFTERDFLVGQIAPEDYSASKIAGERAVRAFFASGGAGTVMRVGTLAPHSRTGRFQRNASDHFLVRYLSSILKLGLAGEWSDQRLALTPVDFVAAAILELADLAAPREGTFHLVNPCELSHRDLLGVLREMGYAIDFVTADEFAPLAMQRARERGLQGALGGVLSLIDQPSGRMLAVDGSETTALLERHGLIYPRPDPAWVRSFVEQLAELGHLPERSAVR